MWIIKNALAVVRQHRRAYLILNLAYYGLVILGMIYSAFNPGPQKMLLESVGQALTEGPLAMVAGAYTSGKLLAAVALTFLVNFFVGSLGSIGLPSLAIPFSGLLMGAYRALTWGVLFSPTDRQLALTMIPHSITLLLEGQAYILAMLAAVVQGQAFLWPATAGGQGRRQGFKAGVRQAAWVYVLVIGVLFIAAVYEAVEVIAMIALTG
jgi:hypothetical protein